VPAMCLLGAHYGPWGTPRRRLILGGFLAAALLVKSLAPGFHTWSLTFLEPRPDIAADHLRAYYELRRANPLILINADDSFYSAALGLPRVRYCMLSPTGEIPKESRHYRETGIIMSVAEFIGPEEGRAKFRRRLHDWNLSEEPLGTVLVARSTDDFTRLVAHEPRADFYVPGDLGRGMAQRVDSAHRVWKLPGGGVFLLAKDSSAALRSPLPAHW
ncbi:MAG: hypothetical protein ACM3QS_15515, partial [Bacteroidota bacterium]